MIELAPLRDRVTDIEGLAHFFLEKYAADLQRMLVGFTPDALDALRRYHYPGNVRELQNIIERAAVLSAVSRTPGVISRELLEPWLNGSPAMLTQVVEAKPSASVSVTPGKTLEEIEREAIVQTLVRFSGHRQKTAHALAIGVRTLGLKLKKWKQQGLVMETL